MLRQNETDNSLRVPGTVHKTRYCRNRAAVRGKDVRPKENCSTGDLSRHVECREARPIEFRLNRAPTKEEGSGKYYATLCRTKSGSA